MALTKIEIAENLIEKYGLEKRIAKQFVELFLKKFVCHWNKENV